MLIINTEQSHVLVSGEWFEIMEDRDGCFYYFNNGQAHYISFEPETSNPIAERILLGFCLLVGALYVSVITYSFLSIL